MIRRFSLLIPLVLILALVACGPAVPTQEPVSPSDETIQTVAPGEADLSANDAYPAAGQESGYSAPGTEDVFASDAYPAPSDGALTGIPAVDDILAIIASGNFSELQARIAYSSAACANAAGLGGPPPCEGGETEGTTVEGLPVLDSEGFWLRKGAVPAKFLAGPYQLVGVYEVNPGASTDSNYPAGQYAIILRNTNTQQIDLLRVTDAGIVRVDFNSQGLTIGFNDYSGFLIPIQ